MAGNLDRKLRLPRIHFTGSFACCKYATCDKRLYFPSEGKLAEDFSPWTIRILRLGLNPRTWIPKASTLPLDHRSRFHWHQVCLLPNPYFYTAFSVLIPSHVTVHILRSTNNVIPYPVAPRGVRRRSAAARLLGLRLRIPHRGHGCPSIVSAVCCQVEVSATGWSLVQRSPTGVVCLSVIGNLR